MYMNIIKTYFPKTWKFIENKGSIKNFYKFDIDTEETANINSKFTESKIDFFNVKFLTPLHINKTPFTFYGMSTQNIVRDDLQYLNLIEKIKNIFSVKIKLSKENSKINLYINNNDFRIPIVAPYEFSDILYNDFELRFAHYLKVLINYEYLTYEILYKDAFITAPYWTFISLPASYLLFKNNEETGNIYRITVITVMLCYLIIGIIVMNLHSKSTNEKLKLFDYYDKYNLATTIVKEERFTISQNISRIKNNLLFFRSYLSKPLLEESVSVIEENLLTDKLSLITEELDTIISNNINQFLIYLL